MQELIAISESTIGNELVKTIEARELWVYLGSKRQFGNWITERIEKYNLVQGIDYIVNKNVNELNQTVSKDVFITIDIAKELAMLENNDKGKEARKYFIECEKKSKQVAIPSYSEALRLYADSLDREKQQQAVIEAQKPAVAFVEKYVESESTFGFREVAKLLDKKENSFREFLVSHKIMYQLNKTWVAYAQHLDAGRFKPVTSVAKNGHAQTVHEFTTKGTEWIAGLMASKQILMEI